MTGVASNEVFKYNLEEAAQVAVEENTRVAGVLGINTAARITLNKPSGCQKKDTLLITDQGILTLEEIGDVNGDTWQNHKINVAQENTMLESTKFFVNGFANTKKILTSGGLELESTPNHQYRIIENGEYVWKRADEISEGDKIPYRVGGYEATHETKLIKFDESTFSVHAFKINQPDILDEDIAWVIGLYFGNGSNHDKGIRIAGDQAKLATLEKAAKIFKEKFNVDAKIYGRSTKNGVLANNADLYVNSQMIKTFLAVNGLEKQFSSEIKFPLVIRKASKSVIKAFIDGYAHADGCFKGKALSFCTVSKKWAEQLVTVLRAVGEDCKMRLMPPTDSSFGTKMRYWIQLRQGRKAEQRYIKRTVKEIYSQLDNLKLETLSFDTVVEVTNGECDTFDIEVPENHCYIANSYVSHNTASLVLGCASGAHDWHNDFYIRRMRIGKTEAIYTYLKNTIPELIEDCVFKPHLEAVLSIPQKAPDGASLRSSGAQSLLNRIQTLSNEWIKPGHNRGVQRHNVSCTVSIKEDEWESVGEWMWTNREDYNGIAVLPYDGGSYVQAPYEDCTEEKYNEMMLLLKEIDLSKVVEYSDNTSHTQEAACAGNACEVTR